MHKEIGTNKYPVFYMYVQMEKKKEADPLLNSENKKTSPALGQC